jgi:hypothetical protein
MQNETVTKPPVGNVDEVMAYAWGQYRVWATTSRKLKSQIDRSSRFVLLLTLAGTLLGTLAPFLGFPPPLRTILPWFAAVALGMATYLAAQLLSESSRESWIKTRALAEAIKSESYKYVTRASPYDDNQASHKLTERINELSQSLSGVLAESVPDEERTKGMPSVPWTIEEYIAGRIRDQIHFYRSASNRHRQAVRKARTVALILGSVSVALSVSAGASANAVAAGGSGNWIAALLGTVTTATAAIGSWFQSGNHLQNALNYQTAQNKLELLLAQHRASNRERTLVNNAESIFQAEHSAWLTQWQADKPGDSRDQSVKGNEKT